MQIDEHPHYQGLALVIAFPTQKLQINMCMWYWNKQVPGLMFLILAMIYGDLSTKQDLIHCFVNKSSLHSSKKSIPKFFVTVEGPYKFFEILQDLKRSKRYLILLNNQVIV